MSTPRAAQHRRSPLRSHLPILSAVLGLIVVGCELHEIPTSGPSEGAVFEATREVIAEKYPSMNIASADQGYVLALTPAEVEGGTTTKRQISVRLVQNYTGAYEPIVRVRHYCDVGTPSMEGDPAAHPIRANPFAKHEWRAMGYLPLEEEALRVAIRERLASMGL